MVTQILLVDDHAMVRQGLRLMLDARPGLDVVGEAASGSEAIEQARDLQPDVILLDLLMPGMTGIEVIQALKAEGIGGYVLVLTSTLEDDMVQQAVQAGASGYILKASHADDLIAAIQQVAAGESVLDPAALQTIMRGIQQADEHDPLEALTDREHDVFELVARGHNNREIAGTLVLSENTVRTHITNLLNKLDLRDRVQVMVFALKRGLIQPEDLP